MQSANFRNLAQARSSRNTVRKALQAKMFFSGISIINRNRRTRLAGREKRDLITSPPRFEGILHAKIIPSAQIRYVP